VTTAEAGKLIEQELDWAAVRPFLQKRRELVRADETLLTELGLRVDSATVVEFGPAALARHAAARDRELSARQELEAAARANFVAQAQCHAAVVDLLESRSCADLARRVDDTAKLRFGLVTGAIAVEVPAPPGWAPLNAGMVETLMGGEGQVWMGPNPYTPQLFGALADQVRSCALVRLALWGGACPGVLAFGSADPQGFTAEMGAELIALLARVAERTAERWPAP
jgi:uncharacterized protein YigA (DUF484 family)